MSLTAEWMSWNGAAWDGPYSTDEIRIMISQKRIESDTLLRNGNNPNVRRVCEWGFANINTGVSAMCDTLNMGFQHNPFYNVHKVEMQQNANQHEKDMFNLRAQRTDEERNRDYNIRKAELAHDKDMFNLRAQRNDEEREREYNRRKAELDAWTSALPLNNSFNLEYQRNSNQFRLEKAGQRNRHNYDMSSMRDRHIFDMTGMRNRHEIDIATTHSNIRIKEFQEIAVPRYQQIERPARLLEHEIGMERTAMANSQSIKMACLFAVAMAAFFISGLTFMALMPGFWNR